MGRPQSLMACWDSLQPAAKTIVRAAQAGWLGTDQIYQLMANYKTVGVPLIAMHPFRPKGACIAWRCNAAGFCARMDACPCACPSNSRAHRVGLSMLSPPITLPCSW